MPYCYDCDESTEPHACAKCDGEADTCGRCGHYYESCQVCGCAFTAAEWEDHHSSHDGFDRHARCCGDCANCTAERKAVSNG